jgi:AraC-like DNA-binding protein
VSAPESTWVTAKPAGVLTPFIERYVGYRMRGFEPAVHRGLPSRHLTFIVSIGPDIDVVRQPDLTQRPARYRCVLAGLAASTALIRHDGHQEGVAVELTPLGTRALFGMPAGAVWNTSLELADVVGPTGDALWERLQEAATWPGRFAACDRVLTALVRDDAEPVPELARAWHVIVGTGGTTMVRDIADDVGWSRQHLARRFTREFGLGPKLAARVVRFGRARDLLRDVPSFVSVAQVAAVCGYYDQAHLDRDFVELAGCPPTEWMREELPSFQDPGEVVPSC